MALKRDGALFGAEARQAKDQKRRFLERHLLEIPAQKIARFYGAKHQFSKTVEEIDELLEAIAQTEKWWREGTAKLTEEQRHALLTESVDVTVLCAQLLHLYAIMWPAKLTVEPLHIVSHTIPELGSLRDQLLSIKRPSYNVPPPGAFYTMTQAIRLGIYVASTDEFQAEVNFKIERQLMRIENEGTLD